MKVTPFSSGDHLVLLCYKTLSIFGQYLSNLPLLFSRGSIILVNMKKQDMNTEMQRVAVFELWNRDRQLLLSRCGLCICLIHGQNVAFPCPGWRSQTNAPWAVACGFTGELGICAHAVSWLRSGRCCVTGRTRQPRINLWWQLQNIFCCCWLQWELQNVCVREFLKSLTCLKYPGQFIRNTVMTKANIKIVLHYFPCYYILLLFTNFFFIYSYASNAFLYHRLLVWAHKIISPWKKHPSIYCVYFLWWLLLWICFI